MSYANLMVTHDDPARIDKQDHLSSRRAVKNRSEGEIVPLCEDRVEKGRCAEQNKLSL